VSIYFKIYFIYLIFSYDVIEFCRETESSNETVWRMNDFDEPTLELMDLLYAELVNNE
jgi:hypothetical protein